eukprot:6128081-Pyramimonas_sp.AAC.1
MLAGAAVPSAVRHSSSTEGQAGGSHDGYSGPILWDVSLRGILLVLVVEVAASHQGEVGAHLEAVADSESAGLRPPPTTTTTTCLHAVSAAVA